MVDLVPLIEQFPCGRHAAHLALRPIPTARLDASAIAAWAAGGESCSSSRALMWSVAAGGRSGEEDPFKPERMSPPRDTADFRRCLVVVHRFPEARRRLRRLAEIGGDWERVVAHWDAIELSFLGSAAEGAARRIWAGERIFGDPEGAASQEVPWWDRRWPKLGIRPAPDAASVALKAALAGTDVPAVEQCRARADLRERLARAEKKVEFEGLLEALIQEASQRIAADPKVAQRLWASLCDRLRKIAYTAALAGVHLKVEERLQDLAERFERGAGEVWQAA